MTIINASHLLMVRCSWWFVFLVVPVRGRSWWFLVVFLAVPGCSQLCSHADVINDSLLMVVFVVVPGGYSVIIIDYFFLFL